MVRDEYNRHMRTEFEQVRDFIIRHYFATQRDDSPFWTYCRSMAPPDSLKHKMELFRERGRVVTYKDGLFLEPSWLAVYFGQRVMPRGYDPRADALDESMLAMELTRYREQVLTAATRMEGHEQFIAKYCPARPPAAMGAPA